MRRLTAVIIVLCMALTVFCSCEKKGYTIVSGHSAGKRFDDIDPSDGQNYSIVKVDRAYGVTPLASPGLFDLTEAVANWCYTDRDYFCVPTGTYALTGEIGTTILKYDKNGTLADTCPVPENPEINSKYVRHMERSGRFVLCDYRVARGGMVIESISLAVLEKDGTLAAKAEIPMRHDLGETIPVMDCFTFSAEEREDGSIRIFVNATTHAFYYDENLTLLNTVSLQAGYSSMGHPGGDVYLLGDTADSLLRVDMAAGSAEHVDDLPIPGSMKAYGTLHYGADGSMYVAYENSVYHIGEDGVLTQILDWGNGALGAQHTPKLWILDDTAAFYAPAGNALGVRDPMQFLDLDGGADMQKRTVLTLGMLQGDDSLARFVSAFNESSDTYFVTIKDYSEKTSGSISAFDHALIYGEDIPDLVAIGSIFDLKKYLDTGLFTDLDGKYGAGLLGCVRSASQYRGHLYALPVGFRAELFVSDSAVYDEPLTWKSLNQMAEQVKGEPGHALTSADWSYVLGDLAVSEHYDVLTGAADFDSDAFREKIRLIDTMKETLTAKEYGNIDLYEEKQYYLTDMHIIDGLKNGDLRFLGMPFYSLDAYGVLKRIFGDHAFTLCGLPSDDGKGARLYGTLYLGITEKTENRDGCSAFLDYLLSDAVQTSPYLTNTALPVTEHAMAQVLDSYRYLYFDKMQTMNGGSEIVDGHIVSYGPKGVLVSPAAHTAQYSEAIAGNRETVELTEDDRLAVLNFFKECRVRGIDDKTVRSIVDEELSAYQAGVKTLEEVSKIMQSRIWLYLNE